jgi:hypothetical protein
MLMERKTIQLIITVIIVFMKSETRTHFLTQKTSRKAKKSGKIQIKISKIGFIIISENF